MDCGDAFQERYGTAFNNARELLKIVDGIETYSCLARLFILNGGIITIGHTAEPRF